MPIRQRERMLQKLDGILKLCATFLNYSRSAKYHNDDM